MPNRPGLLRQDTRLCPKQVACDGAYLLNDREMCGPCEKTLRKRGVAVKPLKGEGYVKYESRRKGKHKKVTP